MPTYNAIKDVGDSLVDLLWSNIQTDPFIKGNIIKNKNDLIVGSVSDLDNKEGLILFLYRVEPNPDMRNRQPELRSNNGNHNLIPPPLPLNLHYLIIPSFNKIEKDHVLLGKVIQIFYDNSILNNADLSGSLKNSGQDLRIVPETMDSEEMNKLWSIFKDQDYRVSASYIVTPVEIESTLIEETQRVEEEPKIEFVPLKEGFLFHLNLHYKQYLVEGSIDPNLKKAFEDNKQLLSKKAKINKINEKQWEIVDGRMKYGIDNIGRQLIVYIN